MARQIRRIATTSAALVAVGAGALGLAGPALADPSDGGYRQYNGVGSDTTQSVLDALAGDAAGIPGVTTQVGSYDAYGAGGSALSPQIQTTQNGPMFDRPLGSGAGVKALSDALTHTPYGTGSVDITGQVDFARSSSGPSASGNALTYVPFARDAVSYAYTGTAGKVGKLTTDQLNQIYSANSPVTINGVQITGVLPQSASGTRKFFLAAIGVTTVGSAVVQTTNAENDGGILDGRVNSVVPFSAAQWVAQKNNVIPDSTENYGYGAPNGKAAVVIKNGTATPVPAFYNAAPYGRNVYNVIATTEVNSNGVGRLFVGTKAPFCNRTAAAIIVKYGFAKLNTATGNPACGSVQITGPFTP